MKITDPKYFLPVVHALQPSDHLVNSANKPQLIRGIVEQTQQKDDFVVKYMAGERMHPEAAMQELLALFIAMEWDMPVANPVLIQISNEFAQLMTTNSLAYQLASKSIGINFGTHYLKNTHIINPKLPLNNHEQEYAKDILLFDIFIQSSDRSEMKPNMLSNNLIVYPIDHEISFSFALLLPFLRNQQPWVIRENDKIWINANILYSKLKGENFNFAKLSQNLSRLNNVFWQKAEGLVPNHWKGDRFTDIKNYLLSICQHNTEYISNLKILLA